MKKLSFLIVAITATMLMPSCIESQQRITANKKTSEKQELPPGYAFGKVEAYIEKNRIEKNMMSQVNSYLGALSAGDINGASSYVYPDIIPYFKKVYPEVIINDFLKETSNMMMEKTQNFENYGMELEVLVHKIDRTIETDKAILCILGMTTQVYNENAKGEKYINTSPTEDDYTVGVSFNGGVNWYFMAFNDDTPNILRLRFTQDVINKVMGY